MVHTKISLKKHALCAGCWIFGLGLRPPSSWGNTELLSSLYFFLIVLFLVVPGLCCCTGFSLLVGNGSYSLAAVCRLLIVVAFLAEHGRQGMWPSGVAGLGF